MDERRVVFLAGWTRALLGVLAIVTLPVLYPALARYRPLFGAYLAWALVEQLLIWKDVGGKLRSFGASLVDLALLTFLVHRAGSVATPLVALYFFSGVMNALAVGLRVGLSQAVIGSLAYTAVVVAESTGHLPYGPDAPRWISREAPGLAEALSAAALVSMMLFVSTGVVGALMRAVRAHERELAQANAKLEELSQRDPLTHLYNRRHLMQRLDLELDRLHRGHPLALLMLDLDRFKRVNDTLGHLKGDVLLQEIGLTLSAATRSTDVPTRYGGDEFVVLLTDADRERADTAGKRLVARVREVGERFDPENPVTASLGIAMARIGDTPASLLRRADEQVYRAKNQGGDRLVAS